MGLLNRLLNLPNSLRSGEPSYYSALRSGDHVAAVPLLHKAMRNDDAQAMAIYATLLALGRGVEQNMDDAADWFRQAAVRGDRVAQAAFGACLASGIGVPVNQHEAAYWLYRSARAGFAPAAHHLGSLVLCNQSVVGKHFNREELEAVLRSAHRLNAERLH